MKRFTRGFTLIELLVVIAIIGILASVVLVSLQSARKKGNDTRVISGIQQLRTQLESDYDGSKYPIACVSGTQCNITTVAAGTVVASTGTWGSSANYATLAKDIYEQSGSSVTVSMTSATAIGGANAYAIYGALPSTSGAQKYYCMDSSGATRSDLSSIPNASTIDTTCN